MDGEKGRVLVVDDEETVRNLLQRILTEAGYSVSTAASGQEALDKVSQLDVGVVLTDVKMPGISGMEVLRQLSVNQPGICVIMATAVADAQTAIEAMKLGAYDYIIKPFNRDDLLLKLQRAIEKRALLFENERYRLDLEKRVGEQTERLQQLFGELVQTLAREHKLIYSLAERQRGGKAILSKLPPELQQPMSSVEEFSEALVRILRRGAKADSGPAADSGKKTRR